MTSLASSYKNKTLLSKDTCKLYIKLNDKNDTIERAIDHNRIKSSALNIGNN